MTGYRLEYRPALDGLRGLAVVAVVAVHSWPTIVPGGGMGVDVFFVLSGFLITMLLVQERHDTSRIDFRGFYRRRAYRLLPPLVAFTVILLAWLWWYGIPLPRADRIYVSNWTLAYGDDIAYFEHTWSLAIEERFYLVWPILLLWWLRRSDTAHALRCSIGTFVAVTVWRLWLELQGASWSRLHFGFDTRADQLLAGCIVALLIWRGWRPPRWAGWAGGAYIAGSILLFPRPQSFGLGFTPIAVAAGLVVAHGATRRVPLLEVAPLRQIGRVSYALYLWNSGIMNIVRTHTGLDNGPLAFVIVGSLSWVVATLSYDLVERPFLALKERRRGSPAQHGPGAYPVDAVVNPGTVQWPQRRTPTESAQPAP